MHDVRLVDGAHAGDQRLRRDLAAEDPLAVGVGLLPAEEVVVELLEVEQRGELARRIAVTAVLSARVGRRSVAVEPGEELLELLGRSPRRSAAAGRAASRLSPDCSARSKESYCCSSAAHDLADLLVGREVAGDLGLA